MNWIQKPVAPERGAKEGIAGVVKGTTVLVAVDVVTEGILFDKAVEEMEEVEAQGIATQMDEIPLKEIRAAVETPIDLALDRLVVVEVLARLELKNLDTKKVNFRKAILKLKGMNYVHYTSFVCNQSLC